MGWGGGGRFGFTFAAGANNNWRLGIDVSNLIKAGGSGGGGGRRGTCLALWIWPNLQEFCKTFILFFSLQSTLPFSLSAFIPSINCHQQRLCLPLENASAYIVNRQRDMGNSWRMQNSVYMGRGKREWFAHMREQYLQKVQIYNSIFMG